MDEPAPFDNDTPAGIVTDDTPVLPPDAPVERPRVLVVDDDERNLLAISTVLEDVGDIVTANSGEEALRHLLRGEFAVILLDVFMPGMDGYETAQIIRSRDQTKRIPIVFLSAVNKEAEHLIKGYAMGAVDYVFKPVEAVVLRSKIAVFVDLFAKTKEIERKARQEQALLDATLRANAERLHAVQELRRAEQRQAAIIQSLPIVLYLEPLKCDPRCPTFVSGDLEAMTGYPFEQVVANPTLWAERLHEQDRERVLVALATRNATGRLSVEYRWQCADGSYKYFHDQAVLLHDAKGAPLEFAGTLTDVTERRSLESQLVQAQKMDSIGKLTGGIAHDFNNLLAAVLGGLGLLERRAQLEEGHQKILAMTMRAADQGTELVRRLLAFARQQQLQPAAIEVPALVEAMNDLLAHTLGGLVHLEWRIADDCWPVFADQPQLELALMNLIINARDAMPDGGTIAISSENRSAPADEVSGRAAGDYVVISVTDKGCGITAANLDKVMEPFFTTKDVGKGTGLGLSMVYGFAKQSNGAFRIDSAPGRGTTAELWLPRAEHAAEGAARAKPVRRRARPGRALSVFLVDDHDDVRAATRAMLEELGHKVAEAANGTDALAALTDNSRQWDLLVTDFAMPRVSGVELVRGARRLHPELPALIVTGYAERDAVRMEEDQVSVLFKPFTLEELSESIEATLARGGGGKRRRTAARA
ncbi:response regulator [Sphingomonas sp.]|uniref:response regulator n=1 Tax=Sphingomonas sp. TaxID=28214 RepID=UPI00286D6F5D|nr:response regulator [Sphingomonas sp.]